jgi:hypothetical protein
VGRSSLCEQDTRPPARVWVTRGRELSPDWTRNPHALPSPEQSKLRNVHENVKGTIHRVGNPPRDAHLQAGTNHKFCICQIESFCWPLKMHTRRVPPKRISVSSLRRLGIGRNLHSRVSANGCGNYWRGWTSACIVLPPAIRPLGPALFTADGATGITDFLVFFSAPASST